MKERSDLELLHDVAEWGDHKEGLVIIADRNKIAVDRFPLNTLNIFVSHADKEVDRIGSRFDLGFH